MTTRNAHVAPSSERCPRRDAPQARFSVHGPPWPPQRQQLADAAGDRRQAEELRLAGRAEVVVHGSLDEPRAGSMKRSHHLHADHSGRRRQRTIDDQLPAEHAEVAVGVAHLQAEQSLDHVVIAATDHLAVPGVTAADLVALDDVDVVGGQWHQQRGLAGVVLRVAVGVEDPLVLRRGESADQRLAVAAVGLVVDDPQPRSVDGQRVEHLARSVGRSVVDDDHLDCRNQRRQRVVHVVDEAADRCLVVVAGEHRRHAGDSSHWSRPAKAVHTRSTSASVISGKHGTLMHSAAHASASGHGACARRSIRRLLRDGQWVVDRRRDAVTLPVRRAYRSRSPLRNTARW